MLKNTLLETIKSRRSIRSFTDGEVSAEEIKTLIEAASFAPSNNNRQPWKFIVLRNKDKKKEITEAVLQKISFLKNEIKNEEVLAVIDAYRDYLLFIKDAPVLIIALCKNPPMIVSEFFRELRLKGSGCMEQNELISTSMAVENLLLAAHALGLGACCTTGPLIAAHEIKNILDIRPPFEPAAVIALGRYDHIPAAAARKPVDDIIEVIE